MDGIRAGGRLCEWQTDDKFAPLSLAVALGADRAAMLRHEPANQSEAHAEAAFGAIQSSSRLHEQLEGTVEHVLRNADAIVADTDRRLALLALGLQHHMATPRGVLRGVVEQVHVDLLQASGVA